MSKWLILDFLEVVQKTSIYRMLTLRGIWHTKFLSMSLFLVSCFIFAIYEHNNNTCL